MRKVLPEMRVKVMAYRHSAALSDLFTWEMSTCIRT
jgi:hypothetical protein